MKFSTFKLVSVKDNSLFLTDHPCCLSLVMNL